MSEVLTVIAPTPDADVNPVTFPFAVKEWCINAPAVNPATNSVFFTSEDGRSYRWNLVTNSLEQAIVLTPGILEPYVPTVIGPDGTVYTLNGGTFFALGSDANVNVTISSSAPDLRQQVVGTPVTFTATVTGSPTGPTARFLQWPHLQWITRHAHRPQCSLNPTDKVLHSSLRQARFSAITSSHRLNGELSRFDSVTMMQSPCQRLECRSRFHQPASWSYVALYRQPFPLFPGALIPRAGPFPDGPDFLQVPSSFRIAERHS